MTLQSSIRQAVLAVIVLMLAGVSSALAQQVTIAYQPLVAIPQGAMKQQKWFEDAAKMPVEWKNFSSGADVNTAFAAGAVDIGLVGLPAFVSGVAQGIPYKLIMLYDIPGAMSGLAVQKDSGVKTVADLKGKRIGVPFGSGADYMLQGALKENGLTPDDVTLVNLQPQPIVAAWSTGQIDAAYIWAPILTTLLEQGGSLVTTDGEMAKKGYFAGDVGLVSDKFAAEHPDLVQAWVEQNLRAVDWVNGNKPGAYDAMMKEFELTPEQLKMAALPPAATFPTRDEQLADQWFGADAKGIIEASTRIGAFLNGNKLISQAPTAEQLAQRTDASFLKNAKAPAAP
jgi:taurine transport system substrate-binding protein